MSDADDELAEDSLHQKTLDEDLAALLALGLQLADVERLWRQRIALGTVSG